MSYRRERALIDSPTRTENTPGSIGSGSVSTAGSIHRHVIDTLSVNGGSSLGSDASDTPREVVLAAGTWLGMQLLADGFAWLPGRLMLQRRHGTLRHLIYLQPRKYNRRDGQIKVQAMLNVRP
jgi:hypothetical protein